MIISKADATSLTDNFRDAGITQISVPLAWRFDKIDIATLVNASDGFIRFYAGLKSVTGGGYEMTLLAVPTDSNQDGNDIISGTDPLIYDFAAPCPMVCDQANSPLLPAPGSPERKSQIFERP
ncbi:MAG: hypothetical protein Q8M15_17240 [Bacteroidota bacterium]|nr:hypothetical protein [Bacteroidota bacterium]